MILNPPSNEYAAFYANYVALAEGKDTNILHLLAALKQSTFQTFSSINPDRQDYAYATGKWTIKQLLNHLIDAERIFAYRLLRLLRGDQTPLPGFDENTYADNADLSNRTLSDLAAEFKAIREGNLFLYNTVTETQSLLSGTASGSMVSVRALLYIIAGHELHHLNILKERYL
ncbi:DinB family protein [Mucilaginibacter sp. CSA2-8R]|uniref:DinB family protein n=1 Tax=Mucilaginibacter sp. CSA2-8R TaxID=3141542 RepID=UPI00315C9339